LSIYPDFASIAMIKVGVIGGRGHTCLLSAQAQAGVELLRPLAAHPQAELILKICGNLRNLRMQSPFSG